MDSSSRSFCISHTNERSGNTPDADVALSTSTTEGESLGWGHSCCSGRVCSCDADQIERGKSKKLLIQSNNVQPKFRRTRTTAEKIEIVRESFQLGRHVTAQRYAIHQSTLSRWRAHHLRAVITDVLGELPKALAQEISNASIDPGLHYFLAQHRDPREGFRQMMAVRGSHRLDDAFKQELQRLADLYAEAKCSTKEGE